jgi:hypothetical protein
VASVWTLLIVEHRGGLARQRGMVSSVVPKYRVIYYACTVPDQGS